MVPPMKQMVLTCLSAIVLAVSSSVNAQSIKVGGLSIDGPNGAEFGYYRLDNQRWVVSVLSKESARNNVTKKKIPSALLITCSKDKIKLEGFISFDTEKLPPEKKSSYEAQIAITFCKNLNRSFGVEVPKPKSNKLE